MRKVLFTCYGGGHAAMVIPVVKQMQQVGGWEPVVLGLTTAKAKLEAAGIPAFGFRELIGPGDEEALRWGEKLAQENHDPCAGVAWEESVAYLGLCYHDLELRLGVDQARELYQAKARHAFLPLNPLRRWLHRLQPDLVVATSSPKSERAAILTAQQQGIPTAILIDLFGLEHEFLSDRDYADRVCVLAPSVRDSFVSRGRRPEQLVVTGNPAFDRLDDARHASHGAQLRKKHGWENCQVILWADTPGFSNANRERILRELVSFQQRDPSYRIVYRPHPNMGSALPQLPAGVFLSDGSIDLPAQLHAAQVVLTTISTVGFEAALLDKPLVKLQFTDPHGPLYDELLAKLDRSGPYEEMGLALPVRRLEDLEGAIRASLTESPEAAHMWRARQQLPAVGTAARRVVEALDDLCASTPFSKSLCHRRCVA